MKKASLQNDPDYFTFTHQTKRKRVSLAFRSRVSSSYKRLWPRETKYFTHFKELFYLISSKHLAETSIHVLSNDSYFGKINGAKRREGITYGFANFSEKTNGTEFFVRKGAPPVYLNPPLQIDIQVSSFKVIRIERRFVPLKQSA